MKKWIGLVLAGALGGACAHNQGAAQTAGGQATPPAQQGEASPTYTPPSSETTPSQPLPSETMPPPSSETTPSQPPPSETTPPPSSPSPDSTNPPPANPNP